MDVASFFLTHVPRRLRAEPRLFGLGRSIDVDIDGIGRWRLDLGAAPSCVPSASAAAPADCSLRMDAAAARDVLAAPWQLRQAFQQGRVRVEGNVALAMHVPQLLTLMQGEAPPSGVSALFPGEAGAVLRAGWPQALVVAQGPLARIPELENIEALRSVHDLLAVWPGTLRLADRHGGREVAPREARALYAAGHHLAFSDAEQVFPGLRPVLARLRWELGLPLNCYGRCPIYASPGGAGEALHFDQNVNLVVQLRGSKRWSVAPNRHVQWPTDRYTTAQPVPSRELRLYGPAQLPVTLPEDARDILLTPGTVLCLPRGEWHQTEAVGDSLSLNFTFDQPAWADLLPGPLREAVLPQARWRALALGAGSPYAQAARVAQATLQALLDDDAALLGPQDADALLARLRPVESAEQPWQSAAPALQGAPA